MGEKTGGLTTMIVTLVAAVAIILIIQVAFPNLTEQITEGMSGIVENTIGEAGSITTGGGGE